MWPCYRLWSEDKATMTELKTSMSMLDVLNANEVLDAINEARAE